MVDDGQNTCQMCMHICLISYRIIMDYVTLENRHVMCCTCDFGTPKIAPLQVSVQNLVHMDPLLSW